VRLKKNLKKGRLPFSYWCINLSKPIEKRKSVYMKKIFIMVALAGGLVACNDNANNVTIKTDSLKQDLDTLGDKIEDKADQALDSAKSKAKDLKEGIEARFDTLKKDIKD
jgi:hypothetical protein